MIGLFSKCRYGLIFCFIIVVVSSCTGKDAKPSDPAPADHSISTSISPRLCANTGLTDGKKLQVRFFGRPKTDSGSKKFTIIFLPDTQHYTEEPQGNHGGKADMFYAQTKWIAKNRASKNIVYVGQLGDCVQNGDSLPLPIKEIEWLRAAAAIKNIEDPKLTGLAEGIPFGISVGNHDQTPNGTVNGTTNLFNKYFGADHFAGRNYYGGHYGSNNDNFYDIFTASGIDFLVISFEFDQTAQFSSKDGPLDWAEHLIQTNPGRKTIVMTHYALSETTGFSRQGRAIYDRLKVYPNFFLLVCGHVHLSDGEAQRTDIFNGNRVHTLLSDYQARAGGGNGLLRILEFDPVSGKIAVTTYSPYNNRYETDPDSKFELSFNMLPFLGQVNNVSPGTKPCFSWNNLSPNTNYEWNMEMYDGQNLSVGPVWNFTTPAASAFPATH